MAQIMDIGLRLTREFNDNWAREDKWLTVGQVKLLPMKLTQAPGIDMGDQGRYVRFAKLASGVNIKAGYQALSDTMTVMYAGRCHHEHDCCGCSFASVNVKHVRGRVFKVSSHHQRNF